MFADALKMVSGSFDALFYVPACIDTRLDNTKRIKAVLCERWQTEVNLTLAHRSAILATESSWNRYLRPALNFHHIPDYMETSGQEQVRVLESCLQNNPEFIFVHRLRCMPPVLQTRNKLPPVFLDMDDIEHVAFRRSIDMPPHWKTKWLLNLQVPAIMSGERRSLRLASKTFVCSATDKLELGKLDSSNSIEVIPNAARISESRPLTSAKRIMVLGQYGYEPNRIGVEFFIDNVWGLVKKELPESTLIVAGPEPEKIRHFKSPPPGVEFTGFVDDLDELYESIRVVVCPILSGGGTRVKLVEAAAYAKPIVSTTVGAEGLELKDDEHVLLRDSPEGIAKACIALLTDDPLANRLATASRIVAQDNYERHSVVEKIAAHLFRRSSS